MNKQIEVYQAVSLGIQVFTTLRTEVSENKLYAKAALEVTSSEIAFCESVALRLNDPETTVGEVTRIFARSLATIDKSVIAPIFQILLDKKIQTAANRYEILLRVRGIED